MSIFITSEEKESASIYEYKLILYNRIVCKQNICNSYIMFETKDWIFSDPQRLNW